MASKPETTFRARIRPLIERLPRTLVISIQQVAVRGVPDLSIICNGHSVWLELKATAKDRATPLQLHCLRGIAAAGGYAMVVKPDNWEAAYAFLQLLSVDVRHREVPAELWLPAKLMTA